MTRTTPLKPRWTRGRGVIPLGRNCGHPLLGPVRLRRTPPRFPWLRNAAIWRCHHSSWLSASACNWRCPHCLAIGWTPTRKPGGRAPLRVSHRAGLLPPTHHRSAGALLNPARGLRLAAGRGHPCGVVGRVLVGGSPVATADPLTRVRGRNGAPACQCRADACTHPQSGWAPGRSCRPQMHARCQRAL